MPQQAGLGQAARHVPHLEPEVPLRVADHVEDGVLFLLDEEAGLLFVLLDPPRAVLPVEPKEHGDDVHLPLRQFLVHDDLPPVGLILQHRLHVPGIHFGRHLFAGKHLPPQHVVGVQRGDPGLHRALTLVVLLGLVVRDPLPLRVLPFIQAQEGPPQLPLIYGHQKLEEMLLHLLPQIVEFLIPVLPECGPRPLLIPKECLEAGILKPTHFGVRYQQVPDLLVLQYFDPGLVFDGLDHLSGCPQFGPVGVEGL
mmetsp:Transcript_77769/g.137102  ORF Transcript_77769/g.137102 Transcript_77769/m.137102 type:complete len:253 (+) Transcript_77769:2753-3511(+)